jgi:transposase-like protein
MSTDPSKQIQNWVDDEVRLQYSRNHRRVRKNKGKAKEQSCVDCNCPAFDWSQRKETDGSSDEHFEPRCRHCHLSYDFTSERAHALQQARQKSGYSEETRAKMRDSRSRQVQTPEKIAKQSAALKGKPWSQARRDAQNAR